jgi:hypothetical protein
MMILLMLLAQASLASPTGAALVAPSDGWQIETSTEALTKATTVSALLEADKPVFNMVGQPEKPSLVLRCKEGNLAFYVTWPEVLDTSITSYGDSTLLAWRADDRRIVDDMWSVSTTGTAAGMFSTGKAVKLLGKLAGAKELAVRMTGQMTQDASFALGDFNSVVTRVSAACGVQIKAAAH